MKEKIYEVIVKVRWKRAEMVLNVSRQKKGEARGTSNSKQIYLDSTCPVFLRVPLDAHCPWHSGATAWHYLKSLCITQAVSGSCQGFASYSLSSIFSFHLASNGMVCL